MTKINPSKIRKELGARLRQAREKIGLTQQQVADAADIDVSYYAQIERGEVNPSFDVLHNIAQTLKIKSLDLS